MTEAQRTSFLFDITTSRKYCNKNKATCLRLSCQQLVLVLCFFQGTETIVKQSACLFSLGNFLNDYRTCVILQIIRFIIHQTHYEQSDWSRAFNQFTIACELDMINAISAADIAFIMSSSTSAWLLSPLECSPLKQNGWMLGSYFV